MWCPHSHAPNTNAIIKKHLVIHQPTPLSHKKRGSFTETPSSCSRLSSPLVGHAANQPAIFVHCCISFPSFRWLGLVQSGLISKGGSRANKPRCSDQKPFQPLHFCRCKPQFTFQCKSVHAIPHTPYFIEAREEPRVVLIVFYLYLGGLYTIHCTSPTDNQNVLYICQLPVIVW